MKKPFKNPFRHHRAKNRNKPRGYSPTQIICVSFVIVIALGTLLLSLPIASRYGRMRVIDAMFTATSATCVTGLVVRDTWTQFTVFGQAVILVLIQVGGLGLVTLTSFFALAMRRRMGFRDLRVLGESVSADGYAQAKDVLRIVVGLAALFEGIGILLLLFAFVPQFGPEGIWVSVFTAISAFCNAGFDLMGINEEYSSFTKYVADPLVNITIMLLIIIGGIGFTIWNEVRIKKLKFSRYSLHAKIVISTTLILVFGGGLFMYIFEKNNTIAGMDTPGAIFASLFGSVTARTAGFNTVDTAALTQESKLLTIVLMFIGGSPGSTAGGIKTTTMAVMIIYIVSYMRGSNGCNVFGRKISSEVIKKAGMVLIINLVLGLTAVIAILATSNMKMDDVLFEVYSAISTVGMTTGITRDLNTVGRIIIIIMMYCGRIGSMTFVLSFVHRPDKANIELPEEKVIIG